MRPFGVDENSVKSYPHDFWAWINFMSVLTKLENTQLSLHQENLHTSYNLHYKNARPSGDNLVSIANSQSRGDKVDSKISYHYGNQIKSDGAQQQF